MISRSYLLASHALRSRSTIVAVPCKVVYPAVAQVGARRSFSIIGDTFTKIATNKMESDKDKRFATMMESMLSNEKWSLRPWKKTLEDQLGSWLMYVPGMKNTAETKELTAFKEMLGAMTDRELDDPMSIDLSVKERVARDTSKSVEEVSRLLQYYKQSLIVQQWLQLKKKNGEPLPKTEPELRVLQENDVRIRAIGSKILQGGVAKRRTGRGRNPF